MNYLVASLAAAVLLAVRFLIPVQPRKEPDMQNFPNIPNADEIAELQNRLAQQKNPGPPSPAPLTVGRIALAVFLGNLLTAAVVAAAYFLFTAK